MPGRRWRLEAKLPPRDTEVVLPPWEDWWKGRENDVVILGGDSIIIIVVPPSKGRGSEGGACGGGGSSGVSLRSILVRIASRRGARKSDVAWMHPIASSIRWGDAAGAILHSSSARTTPVLW